MIRSINKGHFRLNRKDIIVNCSIPKINILSIGNLFVVTLKKKKKKKKKKKIYIYIYIIYIYIYIYIYYIFMIIFIMKQKFPNIESKL